MTLTWIKVTRHFQLIGKKRKKGKRKQYKMNSIILFYQNFVHSYHHPLIERNVEHTFQQQQPLVIKSGQRTFNGTLINLTCLEH